jgi:hypothetical protein
MKAFQYALFSPEFYAMREKNDKKQRIHSVEMVQTCFLNSQTAEGALKEAKQMGYIHPIVGLTEELYETTQANHLRH